MSTLSGRCTPSDGQVSDTGTQICDPKVYQCPRREIAVLTVPPKSKSTPGSDGPVAQDRGESHSSLASSPDFPLDRTTVSSFLSGLYRDDDSDPSQSMAAAAEFYNLLIPKVRGPPVKEDCSFLAFGPPCRFDDNSATLSDSSSDDDCDGNVTGTSVSGRHFRS